MNKKNKNKPCSIFINDEMEKLNIPVSENGQPKVFDSVMNALNYAKSVGLKAGYVIK